MLSRGKTSKGGVELKDVDEEESLQTYEDIAEDIQDSEADDEEDEDYNCEEFDSIDYDSTIEQICEVEALQKVLNYLQQSNQMVYEAFVNAVGAD